MIKTVIGIKYIRLGAPALSHSNSIQATIANKTRDAKCPKCEIIIQPTKETVLEVLNIKFFCFLSNLAILKVVIPRLKIDTKMDKAVKGTKIEIDY